MFSLTKWYIDCVAPDGRSAIGYWLSVSWKGLHFSFTGLAAHTPGSPPRFWQRRTRAVEPARAGGLFEWQDPDLGVTARGQARQPPFGLRLVDDERGMAAWECVACPAGLSVELPDHETIAGLGYVERLTIGFPPWGLRIDDLRWGRWIAADGEQSVVWIDWQGRDRLTAVWVDGARDPKGSVRDDGVALSEGGLTIAEPRQLHHRALREVLGGFAPMTSLVPGAWLGVEDCKSLGRGTLDRPGGQPVSGWAVYEHVRFP